MKWLNFKRQTILKTLGTSNSTKVEYYRLLHTQHELSLTIQVLQPRVLTAQELADQQKEAQASEEIAEASAKDPFDVEANRNKLLREYEALKDQVEGFAKDKTR